MDTKITYNINISDLKNYKKTVLPQIKKGRSLNLVNNQNQSPYNDKGYTGYAVIIPIKKYKQLHLYIGKYLTKDFFSMIIKKYPNAKAICFDSKTLRILLPDNEAMKLDMPLNPQDIHSYFLYWLKYNHDHFTPDKITKSPFLITTQLAPGAELNASTPIRDGILTINHKKFRYSVTDSALCPTDYDTFIIRKIVSRNNASKHKTNKKADKSHEE